jgi:class 3 adenylate cyclase/tetratricopeptide (TPR) repeat protein
MHDRRYWDLLKRTLPASAVRHLLEDDSPGGFRVFSFDGTALIVGPEMLRAAEPPVSSETLATFCQDVLEPLGGEVARFANRHVCVAFHGPGHELRGVAAALRAREIAEFRRASIGLGAGEVSYKVVGATGQQTLLFAGPTPRDAVILRSLASPGQVLISPELCRRLGDDVETTASGDAHEVVSCARPQPFQSEQIAEPEDLVAAIGKLEPFVPVPLATRLRYVPDNWRVERELRRTAIAVTEFCGVGFELREELLEIAERFMVSVRAGGGLLISTDPAKAGYRAVTVFGLHSPTDSDLERAVLSLLGAHEALGELSKSRGWDIYVRSAAQYGELLFGAFGSRERYDMSLVGEPLVEVERLLDRAGPGQLVLGESQVIELSGHFLVEECDVGLLSVKGFRSSAARYAVRRSRARRIEGRSIEVAQLRELTDKALKGHGRVIAITGDAGVGKSCLLAPLLDRFVEVGKGVICKCTLGTGARPLSPLASILQNYAGATGPDDPQLQAKFEAVLDDAKMEEAERATLRALVLGRKVEATIADYDGAVAHFEQMLRACVELLKRSASQAPILLVVEDFHLADPISRRFLGRLRELIRDVPILLIATYRLDPGTKAFASSFDKVFELAPLGLRDATRLITHYFGAERVDPGLEVLLWQRTRGNPRELVELLSILRDRGLLRYEDGTLSSAVPVGEFEALVSPSKSGVALMRLDALGAAERAILRRAAVIGTLFEHAVLQEMIDPDLKAVLELSLGTLQERGILTQEVAARRAYRFRDDGLRAAVYATIPATERARLHGGAADALERVRAGAHDEICGVLARHREQAEQYRMAAYWFERSVNLLASSSLDEDAMNEIEHWEACVARLTEEEEPSRNARARMALTKLVVTARHFSAADALLLARDISTDLRGELTPSEAALCDLWHGIALLNTGESNQAKARLSRAYETSSDSVVRCDAALRLSKCSSGEAQRDWLTRAAHELREKEGFWNDKVDLARACAALDDGEFDEARIINSQVRERSLRAGRIKIAAIATSNLADCDLHFGDVEEARRGFTEASVMSRALSTRLEEAIEELNVGEATLYSGEPRPAIPRLQPALRIAREIRHVFIEVTALVHLGAALGLDGQCDEGLSRLEEGLAMARRHRLKALELTALLHLAHVRIEGGADGDAIRADLSACEKSAETASPLLRRRLYHLQALSRREVPMRPLSMIA